MYIHCICMPKCGQHFLPVDRPSVARKVAETTTKSFNSFNSGRCEQKQGEFSPPPQNAWFISHGKPY